MYVRGVLKGYLYARYARTCLSEKLDGKKIYNEKK